MDLAIKRADVETILITRVDGHDANIATVRPDHGPVTELPRIPKNVSVCTNAGRYCRSDKSDKEKNAGKTRSCCGLADHSGFIASDGIVPEGPIRFLDDETNKDVCT